MSDASNEQDPHEFRRRQWLALLPGLVMAAGAEAQDAARTQPQAYRVTLDNDQMRVLDLVGRPGMGVCGSGVRSHPPHLTVALGDCKVRVRENGKEFVAEQDRRRVLEPGRHARDRERHRPGRARADRGAEDDVFGQGLTREGRPMPTPTALIAEDEGVLRTELRAAPGAPVARVAPVSPRHRTVSRPSR